MTQPDNLKADLLCAAAALLAHQNCSSADVGTLPGGQRVLVGDDAAILRMLQRRAEVDQ